MYLSVLSAQEDNGDDSSGTDSDGSNDNGSSCSSGSGSRHRVRAARRQRRARDSPSTDAADSVGDDDLKSLLDLLPGDQRCDAC